MKRIVFTLGCFLSASIAMAQTTISASDMPTAGDTLRYSSADPFSVPGITAGGSGVSWDFSTMLPQAQAVDTYKTAINISPLLALSFGTSIGYRTSVDALTGGLPLPISISDVYQLFQTRTNPSRFVAKGYAATINGITMPMPYSDEDELYYFPLQYGDSNTSTYSLSFSLPGIGSLKMDGTRTTVVDGEGTVKTPHFTTPVNCIRVRSVSDEVDSISVNGSPIVLPRVTIDYKWLANGEHYPVVWYTEASLMGQTTPVALRYRDHYRPGLGISNTPTSVSVLTAFPNPATGVVNIQVPDTWRSYTVELFDMQGKLLMQAQNRNTIDMATLPGGDYLVRVSCGLRIGFARIAR